MGDWILSLSAIESFAAWQETHLVTVQPEHYLQVIYVSRL